MCKFSCVFRFDFGIHTNLSALVSSLRMSMVSWAREFILHMRHSSLYILLPCFLLPIWNISEPLTPVPLNEGNGGSGSEICDSRWI